MLQQIGDTWSWIRPQVDRFGDGWIVWIDGGRAEAPGPTWSRGDAEVAAAVAREHNSAAQLRAETGT